MKVQENKINFVTGKRKEKRKRNRKGEKSCRILDIPLWWLPPPPSSSSFFLSSFISISTTWPTFWFPCYFGYYQLISNNHSVFQSRCPLDHLHSQVPCPLNGWKRVKDHGRTVQHQAGGYPLHSAISFYYALFLGNLDFPYLESFCGNFSKLPQHCSCRTLHHLAQPNPNDISHSLVIVPSPCLFREPGSANVSLVSLTPDMI